MTRTAIHFVRQLTMTFAITAATAFLTVGSVHAQHALGGGNRLDANLGVGTARINMPTPVEDFRARNLIVTGNIAGGRGFRGAVGYGAETDFRDITGVDDLFSFRADAALSAPGLFTTPGLQQLRFGRDLGALALRRGDGGVTAGMVTEPYQPGLRDEFRAQRPFDDRLRLDAIMAAAGTSARLDVPEPARPIGLAMAEQGRLMAFEASPLRGLTAMPIDDPRILLGLTPYDAARLRAERPDALPRDLIRRHETDFTALLDPGRLDTLPRDERLQPLTITGEPMAGILDRIARRYADRTDAVVHLDQRTLEQLGDEYRDLRDRLARLSPAERWRMDAELADAERVTFDIDEERLPGMARRDPAPLPDVGVRPEEEEDEVRARFAVGEPIPPGHLDRLFDALRHGQRVDQLATEGNTRFDELMTEGERFLRAGEYFQAERRFLRALRIMPGHPLGMVGAAHAQLGAGLQLPAALSIRRMLSGHPELIDARYGPELLPARPRLVQVVDAAEDRLVRTPGDEADYGLVIAYIGHQIEDRQLVARGLDLMAEADPDDPFVTVLRSVWLAPADRGERSPERRTDAPPDPQRAPAAPEK